MKPTRTKYNSHVHIDTCHLSFTTIDYDNYRTHQSHEFKLLRIPSKKDYLFSYEIYTSLNGNLFHFATLHHQYSYTPEYSTLTVHNYSFVHATWSNILNHIIYDFRLDISIRKLEIALDTNKNILKKLHSVYMKTDNLNISDSRYDFDNYGKTKLLKQQGYKYYFNHTASQYLSNTKSSVKSQYDRFESKRNEIDQSSHKYYIDNYLLPYFDTSLPYFRWEKTLFFEDLTYKNDVYLDTTTGEVLSRHHYEKLPNALRYNYDKSIEYSKLDIDFNQLENPNYLISVFNHFSLFNHDVILDTYAKAPHFKPTYVKKFKVIIPRPRKLTIEAKKQAIMTLSEEFDRINNLFVMPLDSTCIDYEQRELEILFNTPIPPSYIHNNSYWLIR